MSKVFVHGWEVVCALLDDHSLVSPHCQGIQGYQSCPGTQKAQTPFMTYYGIFTFTLSNVFAHDTDGKLLHRKDKSWSSLKMCSVYRFWIYRCEHSHAPLGFLLGLVVHLLPYGPFGQMGPQVHLVPSAPGRLAVLAFLEHPMYHRWKKKIII